MDDFLKEGGINIDEIDENEEAALKRKAVEEEKKKKEAEKSNTDPDLMMHGYLNKSSMKTGKDEDDEDILGKLVGTLGTGMKMGVKLFAETVRIKSTRMFFAIKGEYLYWYSHERAR